MSGNSSIATRVPTPRTVTPRTVMPRPGTPGSGTPGSGATRHLRVLAQAEPRFDLRTAACVTLAGLAAGMALALAVMTWREVPGRRAASAAAAAMAPASESPRAATPRVQPEPDGVVLGPAAEPRPTIWPGRHAALPAAGRLEHPGATSLAFRPDGTELVTVDPSGHKRFWSLPEGHLLRAWDGNTGDGAPTWTGAGLMFAAFRELVTMDATSGVRLPLPWDGLARRLVVSRDGGHVAWLRPDGTRLYRRTDRSFEAEGGPQVGAGAAFSPDGQLVALANGAGGARLIGFADQAVRELEPRSASAVAPQADHQPLAFSEDSSQLAVAGGDALRVFDVATGQVLRTLPLHGQAVNVALSPSGRWVAALARGGASPVHVWEVRSGTPVHVGDLTGETCAFSPDHRALAVLGAGRVRVWDMVSGTED